jgi:hypothetical protein
VVHYAVVGLLGGRGVLGVRVALLHVNFESGRL